MTTLTQVAPSKAPLGRVAWLRALLDSKSSTSLLGCSPGQLTGTRKSLAEVYRSFYRSEEREHPATTRPLGVSEGEHCEGRKGGPQDRPSRGANATSAEGSNKGKLQFMVLLCSSISLAIIILE